MRSAHSHIRLFQSQLDGADKDSRFEEDFYIDLVFSPAEAGGDMEESPDNLRLQDPAFWDTVSTKQQSRQSSTACVDTPQSEAASFSIGDDSQKSSGAAAAVGPAGAAAAVDDNSQWNDAADDDLMQQLEALSAPPAEEIIPESTFDAAASTVDAAASTVDAAASTVDAAASTADAAPQNTVLDDEIAALAELEKELGLDDDTPTEAAGDDDSDENLDEGDFDENLDKEFDDLEQYISKYAE